LDNTGNLNFVLINCPEVPLKNEKLKSDKRVFIYPNPSEDNIIIECQENPSGKLFASIFTIDGRQLYIGLK